MKFSALQKITIIMKTIAPLIFFMLLVVSGSSNAQVKLLDFHPPPHDTLGYSQIRCVYEQQVLSGSLKSPKHAKELMFLQIGSGVSKYMSYPSFYGDSLMEDDIKKKNNLDLVEAIQSGRYKSGKDNIELFKNFPEQKNTVSDDIGFGRYIYEEDIITPQWKIEKDTATILGYLCTKATTTFYGRNYMAWFTPDIPISEGPWKLIGLPGLILRAYDDKGDVSFECTQIQKISWSDPILKKPLGRTRVKTTKERFYKQLKQYCDNPSGFLNNNPRVTSDAPPKTLPKKLYNPIELSE
jgi:GLPGLI family protein